MWLYRRIRLILTFKSSGPLLSYSLSYSKWQFVLLLLSYSLLESFCCFVILVVVVVLFIVLFNITVVENIFNNKFGYSSKHYRSVNQLLLLYDSSICYGSKESKLEHVYKVGTYTTSTVGYILYTILYILLYT